MAEEQQNNDQKGLDLRGRVPSTEQINKRTVLIGGGVAAALIIALIGFGFLGGGDDESQQQAQGGQGQIQENPDDPAFAQQNSPQPSPNDNSWRVSPDAATSPGAQAAREAQNRAASRRSARPPRSMQTPNRNVGGSPPPPTSRGNQGRQGSSGQSPRQQSYKQALQAPMVAGGSGADAIQQRARERRQQRQNARQPRQRGRAAPPGPGPMRPVPNADSMRAQMVNDILGQTAGPQGRPAPGRPAQRPRASRRRAAPREMGSGGRASVPGPGSVGTPPINGPGPPRAQSPAPGAQGNGSSMSGDAGSGSMGGVSSTPGRSQFQDRATQKAAKGVYIASQVNEPISQYEIKAGTVVPAVLETALNSDLPGEIVARVTRPVYDRTHQYVLIPAGTKLIGSYSSAIQVGQSRALLAWTRMIYPNGNSVPLPGLSGKNLEGATGIEGDVNNHYGRMLATAGAIALVGAGVQLAVPQDNASSFGRQSQDPQSVIARQIALELSRLGTQLLQRQMEIEPTLTVEQGRRFYVYFNRDLAFESPYGGESAEPRFRRYGDFGDVTQPRRVYNQQVNDSTYRQRIVPIEDMPRRPREDGQR